MKNILLTIAQIALVVLWAILTWKVEPVAWNIPTGFINLDQVWGLIVAVFTLVPAVYLQQLKDKKKD